MRNIQMTYLKSVSNSRSSPSGMNDHRGATSRTTTVYSFSFPTYKPNGERTYLGQTPPSLVPSIRSDASDQPPERLYASAVPTVLAQCTLLLQGRRL